MRSIIIAAALATASADRAAAATSDTQIWTIASASGRLAEGVLGSVELTGRYVDDASRLGQLETRLQLGTPVARSVTLWAGYVHVSNFNLGRSATLEDQAVEQLNWTIGKVGRATLSSRTRLEQRFQKGVDGVAWRTREQLRLAVPLGRRAPTALLWVEPFVSLNRTSAVRPGIDQVRTFAGVAIPVAKTADVEIGYLNQYLNRAAGDRSNNTLSVAVALRF